jgi:hypothetical protein
VDIAGLDCPRNGYFIDTCGLYERRRDGLLAWPLRMVNKSWIDIEAFLEAFEKACRIHHLRIGRDLMVRSFAAAREKAAWSKRYCELAAIARAKLYPDLKGDRRLIMTPKELVTVHREVVRMIQAEGATIGPRIASWTD